MDNPNTQQDTESHEPTIHQDINPASDTVTVPETTDMPTAQNAPLQQDGTGQVGAPIVTNVTTPLPSQPSENSAGVIVLQWLTYAFWGWTLLAVNTLIFMVIFSLLKHVDLSTIIPYAIASVLVLLPISLVCDVF